MRLLAIVREQWPYLLGALGLGGVAYVAIATRPGASSASLGTPDRSVPDPPLRWIPVPPPYRLFNGDLYRACVDVPFGAGWLATAARIADGAKKMGFSGVLVHDSRPADWPGPDSCDRFVEAVWSLEDRIVEENSHVKAAWRRSRA